MNKSLTDLKAGLDYAKSKVLYCETNESYDEKNQDELEYWRGKIWEFERLIDESARILEG